MLRRSLKLNRKCLLDYLKNRFWIERKCSSLIAADEDIKKNGIEIFKAEQKRQLEEIGRVEKIDVEVSTPAGDVSLIMNQEISTPYDCCKHISLSLCQRSPLALVDDKILWDMHRPLPSNCKLRFLSFNDEDPFSLNKVFWRTGSFILGAVISKAFKNGVNILLHSFPPPWIRTGSFIYDAVLNVPNWKPTVDELKILSAEFLIFVQQNHKIERLRVKKSIALEIFYENPFKRQQIPKMADISHDKLVTLYKVDDHIDISAGPMIGDTSFFGRCSVTNVFRLNSTIENLYRFQGIALPKGIMLNHFAYKIIQEKGSLLNEADFPGKPIENGNLYGHLPKPSDSDVRLRQGDI